MAHDLMTARFGNNSALFPGVHRPQDAYCWLDDSDDEDDALKPQAHPLPRRIAPLNSNAGHPATLIDPRNGNGKRAHHVNSNETTDSDSKKMRFEIKQREAVPQSHQSKTSTRPSTSNVSVSPPSVMRGAAHIPPQQSGHPRQAMPPAIQHPTHHPNAHGAAASILTPQLPSARSYQTPWEVKQEGTQPIAPTNRRPDAWPLGRITPPVIKIEERQTPWVTAPTTSGPFLVDDSSDEEASTDVAQDSKLSMAMVKRKVNAGVGAVRSRMDTVHREHQLAESRKRRQEAEEMKRETPSSSGAREIVNDEKHFDGIDVESPLPAAEIRVAVPMARRNYADASVEAHRKAMSPAKPSVTDLTDSNKSHSTPQAPPTTHNAPGSRPLPTTSTQARDVGNIYQRGELVEAKHRKDAEKRALLHAQALDQKNKREAEAPEASETARRSAAEKQQQHAVTKTQEEHEQQAKRQAAAADSEDRRMEELAEAKRQKEADLLAQVHAIDEMHRKKAEAEAMRRYEAEGEQRARAKIQAEYDQQLRNRAETAQRSRALVEAQRKLDAQKTIDDEKEAAAKKAEQEKCRVERRQWDERVRAKEKQRDALRQRRAEAEKEKSVLNDREAALARLSAVKPPQAVKEVAPAIAGVGDVNHIVAKHTVAQSLHFKDGRDGSRAADVARKTVKKIQEKDARGGLLETKEKDGGKREGEGGEMSQRDRRIKTIAGRNIRYREAAEKEDGEEEDGGLVLENNERAKPAQGPMHESSVSDRKAHGLRRHDSRAPTPISPPMPEGPRALNSAEGQVLLAHATSPKAHGNRQSTAVPSKPRCHERPLGEILPADAQLVRWRDQGMRFQDIVVLFEKQFGSGKAVDTHRRRYKIVKEALKTAGVEEHLLELLVAGGQDAREKVNLAVHGRWPLKVVGGGGEQERARGAKGHFLSMEERAGGQKAAAATTAKKGGLGRAVLDPFVSSTTEGTLALDDPGVRPQTGGKTMNEAAFRYYLECMAEVQTEEESEPTPSREQSPITEGDCYHFAYQVQRRERTQVDLDGGYELEDDPWQFCDEALDNLGAANAKAVLEALSMPKQWEQSADADCAYDLQSRTLRDGIKLFSVDWKGVGKVQTSVQRLTNYRHDGILPTSKDGWAPKTVYHVRSRTTTRSGGQDDDDLFGVTASTDTTVNVDNAVYTTLEEANTVAIKHFVSIAFSPTSAHLQQRAMEVQAAEKKVEAELEEDGNEYGEEVLFWKEVRDDEGRRKVEVWVEEGTLRGPRNL